MDNPLNKIFNWNTKISCTNNRSKIIYNHNKKLVGKSLIHYHQTNKLHCNCRNEEDCSMGGMSNSEKVVD